MERRKRNQSKDQTVMDSQHFKFLTTDIPLLLTTLSFPVVSHYEVDPVLHYFHL